MPRLRIHAVSTRCRACTSPLLQTLSSSSSSSSSSERFPTHRIDVWNRMCQPDIILLNFFSPPQNVLTAWLCHLSVCCPAILRSHTTVCDCGASCEEEICHVCYVFNKYSRVNSADLPDWFGVCFGVLHGRAGIFWTQHGHTHTHTHTYTHIVTAATSCKSCKSNSQSWKFLFGFIGWTGRIGWIKWYLCF